MSHFRFTFTKKVIWGGCIKVHVCKFILSSKKCFTPKSGIMTQHDFSVILLKLNPHQFLHTQWFSSLQWMDDATLAKAWSANCLALSPNPPARPVESRTYLTNLFAYHDYVKMLSNEYVQDWNPLKAGREQHLHCVLPKLLCKHEEAVFCQCSYDSAWKEERSGSVFVFHWVLLIYANISM